MSNPTEPLTTLNDVRAPHNLVAAISGLAAARDLIERLERAGVDADHISLLGAQLAGTEDVADPAGSDSPVAETATGAATGALTGAGVAAAAGVALGIPGVGPLVAGGIWAVLGAAVGSLVGAATHTGLSEAWLHTFETVKAGNVAVGVHTDDLGELAVAADVFGDTDTLSVNRFDDRTA